MNKNSALIVKVAGIALLVLGVGLAIWGFQMSESVTSEMSQFLTGSDTDKVMGLYIGGGISGAVGLFLLLWK